MPRHFEDPVVNKLGFCGLNVSTAKLKDRIGFAVGLEFWLSLVCNN